MTTTAWFGLNRGIERQDVIDAVHAELLRHMARAHIANASQIAVDTGYAVRSIYGFVAKQPADMNLNLAQALVLAYPEIGLRIGEPIVCRCCGRIARP